MNSAITIILGLIFVSCIAVRLFSFFIEISDIHKEKGTCKIIKFKKVLIELDKFFCYSLINLMVLLMFWKFIFWIVESTSDNNWVKYLSIIPAGLIIILPKLFALSLHKDLHWRILINMILAGFSATLSYLIIVFGFTGMIIASVLTFIFYAAIILFFILYNKYANEYTDWDEVC